MEPNRRANNRREGSERNRLEQLGTEQIGKPRNRMEKLGNEWEGPKQNINTRNETERQGTEWKGSKPNRKLRNCERIVKSWNGRERNESEIVGGAEGKGSEWIESDRRESERNGHIAIDIDTINISSFFQKRAGLFNFKFETLFTINHKQGSTYYREK